MAFFSLLEADSISIFIKNMFTSLIAILVITQSFKYVFLDDSLMNKDML